MVEDSGCVEELQAATASAAGTRTLPTDAGDRATSTNSANADGSGELQQEDPEAEIRFRNYVPKDPRLRQFCLPRPSVEELEKQIAREARNAVESAKQEDILSQIAPRRPNWDLKRDVERKISILSRRTDKAIVQLIRQKVESSQTSKEIVKESAGKKDFESSAEALTREQIEIGQSVMTAMDEIDKLNDDDDDDM